MTAIACKDGVIAADTAYWLGPIISQYCDKIRRLKDRRLFAGSGQLSTIEACFAWLNGDAEKPAPDGEPFTGIVLSHMGIVRIDNRMLLYPGGEISVAGAHSEFLLGALYAGASAEEAVRLAIRYGDSAGGDVQVERL